MKSLSLHMLVLMVCLTVVGRLGAQAANNPRYQQLVTIGNQALADKDFGQAIQAFQMTVSLFPKDAPAKQLLKQAQVALKTAQAAYKANMLAGREAVGTKDFAGAQTAFTAAGASLPYVKNDVLTAQRFFKGTVALQNGFGNLNVANYSNVSQYYSSAQQLLGKDSYAKAPLAELKTGLDAGTVMFEMAEKTGLAALNMGNVDVAIPALRQATQWFPSNKNAASLLNKGLQFALNNPVELNQAIQAGYITQNLNAFVGNDQGSVKFNVQTTRTFPWTLRVANATVLQTPDPVNALYQNMVTRGGDHLLTIKNGVTNSSIVSAACISYTRNVPNSTNPFTVAQTDQGNLLKVLSVPKYQAQKYFRITQFAVWIVQSNPPANAMDIRLNGYGGPPTAADLTMVADLLTQAGLDPTTFKAFQQ